VSNKITYKESDVVEYYSKQTNLQPPEETILNLFKGSLSEMKMLDIGVGGGRTTVHFAQLVKTYEAIDYSEEMIVE
jgi:ubiquinone/menaquinone biosynthesis C-methylase UbiE